MGEAASRLGVSPSTVRRWVRSGRLRADRALVGDGFEYRIYLEEGSGAEASVNGSATPSVEASEPPPVKAIVEASVERSAAMAAYSEALLRPLVGTINNQQEIIRQQAEQVGRLSAELEQVRERLAAQEAPKTEMAPEPTPPAEAVSRPSTGLWARFVGWLGG
jgi:excisionase family DNA binding protein